MTESRKTFSFCLASFALLLALGGCKRDGASKPVVVDVITNAAEIAAAKQVWAEERERKLNKLLQEPKLIRIFDHECMALIEEQRQRSVDALVELRDSSSSTSETKIHAICALKLLEVAPSADRLDQLGRTNTEATMALLFALQSDDFYPIKQPLPEPLRQFVVASIKHPERSVRDAAVHLAAWRNIQEARAALLSLLQQGDSAEPALLKAAARLCPSPEVLHKLEVRLKVENAIASDGILGAIADLIEATSDPALKQQAASICGRHLKRQPDQRWMDGDTMGALHAIANLPSPHAKATLADIIRSSKWRLMRETALAQLQKLDPTSAQQLAKETRLKLPEPLETATSRRPQRTSQELAAICVRHGLVTQAEAERALASAAARAKGEEEEAASEHEYAEGFFHAANRFITFDVETGMCPNRHDLLLNDFAKASAGLFRPEAAFERYQDPSAQNASEGWRETGKGRYLVQFIVGQTLYRFEPKDLGDWYDVAAVLTAIHRALADAGIAERFVALEGGGQDAAFIFAKPESLSAAATELGLKLGQDPDQARKLGQAYEEQVLRKLKEEL